MTDHQPEGTQLVTQLGDAVGGPEVPSDPDPETETVDLRRKLWNVQRLGESLAGSGNLAIRGCGEQVLAVLGDAVLPVGDVLDPKHLQAALEALSTAVAGAEYEHQKKRYKAAWAYLDALEGKDSAEEERLPRLCPACLHDGVLERTLGRAEAAEGKLAELRDACRSIPSPIANRILAIIGTEGNEGQ